MNYYREKNICHCFACGVNADIFELIGWDYNTSDFNEQFKIGCDLFGLDIGQTSHTRARIKPVRKYDKTKNEDERAPLEVRHNVYTAMKDIFGLRSVNEKHLSEVRHLTEKRIKTDYFWMPKEWPKGTINKIMKLASCSPDMLKKVPGFYQDGAGNLTHRKESGIAILIRDVDGKAQGIQIRRDTAEKGNRYVWFSSRFAKGGTSPGAAKDVVIPRRPKKILCVTEGRFKAESLAQKGNITISLQGVANWKNIDQVIQKLREKYTLHTIYLMFDADVMGNIQIMKTLQKMTEYLHQTLPDMQVKTGVWKIESGKGIDDFFYSGVLQQNHNIKYLDAGEFYQKCLNSIEPVQKALGLRSLKHLTEERERS